MIELDQKGEFPFKSNDASTFIETLVKRFHDDCYDDKVAHDGDDSQSAPLLCSVAF